MFAIRQATKPLGRMRQQLGHETFYGCYITLSKPGPSASIRWINSQTVQTHENQTPEEFQDEDIFSSQRRSLTRGQKNMSNRGYDRQTPRQTKSRFGSAKVEEEERFASSHQITRSINYYITRNRPPVLSKRMVEWGIAGDELRKGAKAIMGNGETYSSDEKCLKDLLLFWWEKSSPHIKTCMDNPSEEQEYWDIVSLASLLEKNATVESIEIHRIVVSSFLGWLERSLIKIGDADQLVTHLKQLQKAADMRFPSLSSNLARMIKRTIHLHVGPTNSGKTYGALQALCKAKVGLYAGPLRLLAHEVWDRINNGTVSPNLPARACNLITGEERRTVDPSAGLLSCTVEMVTPGMALDVAVIDEIQMIGDPERGFAWTAAVVNLAAKELHLCGENSVVPLIKRIADDCGDQVVVHEYQRLTPLRVGESIESLKNVQKGDCVVAFSRTGLFSIKEQIESETGLKCAIAYGALPPETKSEQAKLFNDPNNDVDVMVASDAIGMGLNLKIKRVIFNDVTKWNGREQIQVSFSQIKQIAGRAGRFGTREKDDEERGGIVTTLKKRDIDVLKAALEAPLKPITHARIAPEISHITDLARLIPINTNNSNMQEPHFKPRSYGQLLSDVDLLTRIDHSTYVAGSIGQQSDLIPLIEAAMPSTSMLTLAERSTFSFSPVNTRDENLMELFGNIVHRYAQGFLVTFSKVEKDLDLLNTMYEIESLYPPSKRTGGEGKHLSSTQAKEEEVFEDDNAKCERTSIQIIDFKTLATLETLHRGLTLYRWLSMRFPVAFPFTNEVEDFKVRAEVAIDFCLELIRANRKSRLAALGRTEKKKKAFHSIGFEKSRFTPSKYNNRITT